MSESKARYTVYQAIDPLQMLFADEGQWRSNCQSHYQCVAVVEVERKDSPLSKVFERTNSHENDWTHNPEVVWCATHAPLRSTSVGDVICGPAGTEWMVMPSGFKLLSAR